ncbi:MAG: AmmeMemoRadiSam system protein A [Pyrinomonadaceae bacterium]
MANRSSIVFAGIAPHPPIMVPEVGRSAIPQVQNSISGMMELARRVIDADVETVVLISPHAPLEFDVFIAYGDDRVYGDFANFNAAETHFEIEVDHEMLHAITTSAATSKYEVLPITDVKLDHGTAVPLYFLLKQGWRGRVVALGYCFLSNEDHLGFGACIKNAAEAVNRRIAFVASGDLSHRLKPHAPAGYNAGAYLFDEQVVDAIEANEPERIAHIDPNLRKLAGECGYRSMLVAIGVTRDLAMNCEVINYEAPFGVGYLVAQLVNVRSDSSVDDGATLPMLAREAVEAFVRDGKQLESPAYSGVLLTTRAPCFVSLKTSDGDLRGCIGTVEPLRETLAEEIVANAINAATHDPRFLPVREDELPTLHYSVDVLLPAEPAEMEHLDPKIYGVIVEDVGGTKRGLLLPDIIGVETAEQQVQIAARKAGIIPGTRLKILRFKVQRFKEAGA